MIKIMACRFDERAGERYIFLPSWKLSVTLATQCRAPILMAGRRLPVRHRNTVGTSPPPRFSPLKAELHLGRPCRLMLIVNVIK